ncbi:MAG: hypothetical protein AAGB31_02520 [Bdellovibrio sp.]
MMKISMPLFISLFGITASVKAQDITVVDVRRNITLSEKDPIYKDFYLNVSPGSGLKKNMVVTVVRKLNIRDASGANAVGEIQVPVGQLKVIAIYDRVAVAREYALLSREDLPMLEQTGIMTGDRVDLQNAFIDKSKPRKTASIASEVPPITEASSASASTPTADTPAAISPATIAPTTAPAPAVAPLATLATPPTPALATAQPSTAAATPGALNEKTAAAAPALQ